MKILLILIVLISLLTTSVSGLNLYANLGVGNITYKTYTIRQYSLMSLKDDNTLILNTTVFNASSTKKIIITLSMISNAIAYAIYRMAKVSNQYGIGGIKVLDIVKVSI